MHSKKKNYDGGAFQRPSVFMEKLVQSISLTLSLTRTTTTNDEDDHRHYHHLHQSQFSFISKVAHQFMNRQLNGILVKNRAETLNGRTGLGTCRRLQISIVENLRDGWLRKQKS